MLFHLPAPEYATVSVVGGYLNRYLCPTSLLYNLILDRCYVFFFMCKLQLLAVTFTYKNTLKALARLKNFKYLIM